LRERQVEGMCKLECVERARVIFVHRCEDPGGPRSVKMVHCIKITANAVKSRDRKILYVILV
jgi:hypothetical protein